MRETLETVPRGCALRRHMATKDWKPSTFDQFYTLVTQYLDVLPAHEKRHEDGRVVHEVLDPDIEEVLRTEECTVDVETPLTPWDTQSQDSLPGEPCRRMGNFRQAMKDGHRKNPNPSGKPAAADAPEQGVGGCLA